jgi:hypothetical protein
MSDYKYTLSSLVGAAKKGTDPKAQYIELFQKTLTDQFYNSSDWWTVQEEISFGSQTYSDVDVRINHVINAETGLKLGDDWKTVLFQDVNHGIELGKHFIFDNNTWLTINTELVKNLTGTCTIRRCNNTLRWIEESTGIYYEEPCCIEYMVKEPRDYATAGSPFMTPGGFLHIEMQFNPRSNLINENQRFLFGNPNHWTCYKVIGTGLNDFRNNETYDNGTARILTLDLIANFVNNELDDITNGIADVGTNVYTITLDKTSASGAAASAIQLTPSITYNGKSTTRTVLWTSSDTAKATVNSSGLVTLVANGTATITATIDGNPAHTHCAITVSASPSVESVIKITPDTNYILEGATKSYTVFLYEDDVIQSDTFTITCDNHSVPAGNFTFSASANGFTIVNKLKNVDSYLTVSCVVGSITRTFKIYLKGAW